MILSNGKEIYANWNIFGLTPELELSAGYDNMIYDDESCGDTLTPSEKVEIANEMIKRWQAFKTINSG